MRTRAQLAAACALLATCLATLAPAARAATPSLAFAPCTEAATFECAHLTVPLDRSGALAGTVTLSVERHVSGAAPARSAVLVLAGGPGQAALPLASFAAKAMAPALAGRDLLVFDQRGTGNSGALRCSALEEPLLATIARPYEHCALELGAARGAYTSVETVQDIDALRSAAGYDKLTLFGTSYGTKVALDYAQRHPDRVEALVLDSVVPAGGEEPFHVSSFQAIAPVIGELCSAGACAGITHDAAGDLARLTARLRAHALAGTVFDGAGHRHRVSLDEEGLFALLVGGDLNPALRALLPAAVSSALRGDAQPLLRLRMLAAGLVPSLPEPPVTEAAPAEDEALFAATTCEETPFPWQRSSAPAARVSEALAALGSHPAAAFAPFDPMTALRSSPTQECAYWPDASTPAPAGGPLPDVPTLILSGEQDLRTPTADARAVAATLPGAQLELVPYVGHSVLGSDLSGCAARAVATFFAGAAVAPCGAGADSFAPTPVSPTRLTAVHPPGGLGGRPGRTLVAALDTLVDLDRQVVGATIEADTELPAGSSFGGLRGGYARLTRGAVRLRGYSFVPGVSLSGALRVSGGRLQPGTLHVAGSAAASGTVRVGSSVLGRVSGDLGGRRFSLTVARARLSSLASTGWPGLARLAGLLQTRRAEDALAPGSAGWLR